MIIESYKRLLVDVRILSGVPIGVPDVITHEWVLTEAPKLDKNLLNYLENGVLEQDLFPEWLSPLLDAFIASRDGKLLRLLRMCLLFCYKAEVEPNDEQIKVAQATFEETDSSCAVWSAANAAGQFRCLLDSSRRMVARVIGRINWLEIEPSHGPGAVFPPSRPTEKSRFLTFYPSIQRWYPYDYNVWCLPSYWVDIMQNMARGTIKEEVDIVAKLVCVPKDSRGPRIICVHPKEAIWIQQGQRKLLEAAIEHNPTTKGRINFTDQSVNGSLALASSIDRRLTTLDLKEASDRISCDLVRSLFGDYVYDIMSCARANKVQLLDGRVIDLQKWAPMGNCLTFPVQSLIFWSLVRAGILSRYGVICDEIYVFGDDILFPTEYYDGALYGLCSSGCVPNVNKTFRRGFFRESCGVDAFNGINVTPHRLRQIDVASSQGALATCTLAKRLRVDGFEHCASWLYKHVASSWGRLPFGNNYNIEGLYEYVANDLGWILRHEPLCTFSHRYHSWRIPVLQAGASKMKVPNGDWYHLLDSLIHLASNSGWFSDRGTEYTVPHRARLQRGWADCLYR
jgi:hypothetical protein